MVDAPAEHQAPKPPPPLPSAQPLGYTNRTRSKTTATEMLLMIAGIILSSAGTVLIVVMTAIALDRARGPGYGTVYGPTWVEPVLAALIVGSVPVAAGLLLLGLAQLLSHLRRIADASGR